MLRRLTSTVRRNLTTTKCLLSLGLAVVPATQALAASGDIYVTTGSDFSGYVSTLYRITPNGDVKSVNNLNGVCCGSNNVTGIAFDSNNDDFILYGQGDIKRALPGGLVTVASAVPSDFYPSVAVDAAGNIITRQGDGTQLYKTSPDGSTTTLITSALPAGTGVAVDADGNYIVLGNAGEVQRVAPTGTITPVATLTCRATDVAIDHNGDYILTSGYLASRTYGCYTLYGNGGPMQRVTPTGEASVVALATNQAGEPFGAAFTGVAVDDNGDYLTVDYSNDRGAGLAKITPAGVKTFIASGLPGFAHRIAIRSGGDSQQIAQLKTQIANLQTQVGELQGDLENLFTNNACSSTADTVDGLLACVATLKDRVALLETLAAEEIYSAGECADFRDLAGKLASKNAPVPAALGDRLSICNVIYP